MDKLKNYNILNIDNLEIKEYIDRGSSGRVYKANYNNNSVICKCFSLDNYYDEESWIEEVYHEMYIYKLINNTEGICECLGYCYKDEEIYLILKDYKTKENLFNYLNTDKYWFKFNRVVDDNQYLYQYKNNKWLFNLDRNSKIYLTINLINCIKNLHEKDVAHCDIKTNNILYNKDTKELILIDFGASQYLNKQKQKIIETNMGTMGYACVQLNNLGLCSKKSDIYSLGVCIIEIWCGAIWNTGNTHKKCRNEVLYYLRKLKIKEPKLADELRKCINLNVDKRPYITTVEKNIKTIFYMV